MKSLKRGAYEKKIKLGSTALEGNNMAIMKIEGTY